MKNLIYIMIAILMAPMAYAECSTDEQVNALALNMYHEARDQGHDGMLLVAEVTINRVENPHFPDTICDVVYQGRQDSRGNMIRNKCQFSWYCDGRSDRARNQEMWDEVEELATSILNGETEILGIGATHYLNPDKVSRMPRWTQKYDFVGNWGDHHFYAMGDRL